MTHATACDDYEETGAIARYVAGRHDPETAAALEDHFLTCERCQHAIQVASVLRTTDIVARPRKTVAPAWAIMMVAASLAGILAVRTLHERSLRALGRVTSAPAFAGMLVRSLSDAPSALFDSAMTVYNKADYATSFRLLTRLNEQAPGDAAVLFFTGASQLMLVNPTGAETSFSAVIAAGATSYYGEALYYRAKARLQQGKQSDAVADLRAAAAENSALAVQARALLRRLEE